MEGCQNDFQKVVKFRVMRLVSQDPNISTRRLADLIGISNGSAFYLIKALIVNRFAMFKNFSVNSNKSIYTHFFAQKVTLKNPN